MQDISVMTAPRAPAVVASLLTIMAAVFVGFLVVGMGLPVLPLQVHDHLGFGPFVVGLVTGAQFVAALVTRMWAGSYADTRGAKRAVIAGLSAAAVAGGLYLLSLELQESPAASLLLLLAGRALLGGGESFIITGALGWGLALVGTKNTGKVMAWLGTAMYAAFAAGAPAGNALYGGHGFAALAWATALVPALVIGVVAPLRPVQPVTRSRPSYLRVLRSVWVPGLALAMSSLGFGAVTAFSALHFAQRGWHSGWMAFTAFALCFMAARMLFGHIVDRSGGVRVAAVSLVIEAAGQLVLWQAAGAGMAIAGAALTGLGYSLVYPGLGVEAMRRAPAESRALAMGAYTCCLDLALGVGMPLLGIIGDHVGLASVFLASAGAICASLAVTLQMRHPAPHHA
jgi:MFS family permease